MSWGYQPAMSGANIVLSHYYGFGPYYILHLHVDVMTSKLLICEYI